MFDFLRRIFRRKESSYWRRDMFTIPCPDEMFISTELSSGFGRRLPCYNTDQCVIIVKKENASGIAKITDGHEEYSLPKHRQHSVPLGCEGKDKHKLTLEELKKKFPLNTKSSRPFFDRKLWTRKPPCSCGRTFSNHETVLKY